MPEIVLALVIIGLLVSPQLLAGFLAKRTGRNFWFWFFISFLIPLISLVILMFMDDKKPEQQGYQLAEHVDRN